MDAKEIFTERDNETLCVLRLLGAVGVLFVGGAAVLGAAPFEVGAGDCCYNNCYWRWGKAKR